jgi:hypothetical protein
MAQMVLFTRDAPTGQPHASDEPLGSEAQGADPNQPTHSAATSRGIRRIGRLLVASGLGLLPWMYVLATGLPAVMAAPRWPAAWIGLDVLEAAGLIATGLLAARGDRRHALAAAATAALLVVDAWFDTMTATSTSDLGAAIAMALCPELPLAAVCCWLAMRASRHGGAAGAR